MGFHYCKYIIGETVKIFGVKFGIVIIVFLCLFIFPNCGTADIETIYTLTNSSSRRVSGIIVGRDVVGTPISFSLNTGETTHFKTIRSRRGAEQIWTIDETPFPPPPPPITSTRNGNTIIFINR